MATTIDLGDFHQGSVDRIELTITKDGSAWNGIDSVGLTFQKPDGSTRFERSMTLSSGNVWYYDTLVGDLDASGWWRIGVLVTDGAIVKRYPYEVAIEVFEQP